MGSKTGTAERAGKDPRTGGEYAPYAWDICFAPYQQPKIATVVFMPDGYTSLNVVPIARDILASYLDAPASQEESLSPYEGLTTYDPTKPASSDEGASSQEVPTHD